MKVGKNKLLQKILIVMLTTLITFNFIMPTVAIATEDDEYDGEVSSLAGPIQSLITLIGDAGMSLMQYIFVGNWDITERVKIDFEMDEIGKYETIQNYLGRSLAEFVKGKHLDIPNFQISPESIFKGDIPAFDINFFQSKYENGNNTYENGHWLYGTKGKINYNNSDVEPFDILKDAGWKYDNEKGYVHPNGTSSDIKEGSWPQTTYKTTYTWTHTDGTYCTLITYKEVYGDGTAEYFYEFSPEKIWIVDSIETRESSAKILQSTVSYWYNILRNISIIGLLSVLVYIGIRIVLSSAAADKSKYKEMLKDWAVAMCLLFFMHYFMNFTVTITQSISEALTTDSTVTSEETTQKVPFEGDRLIGDVRLRLQTEEKLSARWAYTVIYLVIVIYTIIFAIMYLKRVIYMAFFTMMAPIVALTYPLDKARDGKAQAFDMWIKEYTFNALIQPFHLIIYYVLVASAMNLAVNNPLYALVAIGFMMPAEKLLRKFFGFNKSETSGVLGGALGGAMIMQGINALSKRAGHSGGKKSGGQESKEKANKGVRTANSGNNMNSIMDELGTNDNQNNSANSNPSNSIPYGDSSYSAEQERLDELAAEGFGPGDDIYDDAQRRLDDRQNLDFASQEDYDTQNIAQVDIPQNDDEIGETEEVEDQNNTQDNSQNDEEKTHRFRAGVSMAGRWALKGARLATKGVGAVTLGTVGVAAGLASDDYSNVLKYGAAGAAAGGLTVGALMNKVPSTAYRIKENIQNERQRFEQDAYSAAERKRRANSRADNEFLNDRATIQLYKDKFPEEDYKKVMQDAIKYREYGIIDNDTIIKAMKLKTKGIGDDRADKRRILIAGTAPSLGRKDVDNYGERLENRGFRKQQAEAMKKAVREFNDFE